MTKLTKKECLDLVIPKQLIDKAKKYGACKEAIHWLNEKPRTIRQLIRCDKYWLRWFILTVPVGRVYREILHTVYPAVKTWYKNGKLHRDNDLPAVICAYEFRSWYKNGKLHRDNDLPAVIYEYGTKCWYKNGKLHRDNDLPATTGGDVQYWCKNGELHRDNDQPAVIYYDGTKHWYKNGKRHRDNDLPAVIHADGLKLWYEDGHLIKSEDMIIVGED